MSITKRAWFCISRKKVKTIILFFILTLISTALLSSYSIKSTTRDMAQKIYETSNAGFSVTSKDKQSPFLLNDVKDIQKTSGIKNHNYRYDALGSLVDKKVVKVEQKVQINNPDKRLSNLVSLKGSTNTSLENDFTSGIFRIEKGRGLTDKDSGKTIIHEELAKANGLKVGDKLKIKGISINGGNSSGNGPSQGNVVSGKDVELEIVGIFSGRKSETNRGLTSDATENTVFTDYKSSQKAMGYSENDYKITTSTFLVSNPKDIDKVIENAKKTSVDFSKLSLTKNSKAFDSISTSLKSFGNIIDVMTLGIIIGSIVILSLVLIFWLRERIYEIGILLSIGISKLKIIGQFILEVIMISVGSYIVSILLGKLTSVFIFKGIVSSASEVGTENVFKNVVPRLDIVNMFSTYGILLVIIGLSVIGTSLIILHKKPKEILTNMS